MSRTFYILTLTRNPGCRIPDAIALRRLLKLLLRTYGLKCVEIRQETAAHTISKQRHGPPELAEQRQGANP